MDPKNQKQRFSAMKKTTDLQQNQKGEQRQEQQNEAMPNSAATGFGHMQIQE